MIRFFCTSFMFGAICTSAMSQGISPIPRIDPFASKADKSTVNLNAVAEMVRTGPTERRMSGIAIALSADQWSAEITNAVLDYLDTKPNLTAEEFALVGQALSRDLGPVNGKIDPRKVAFFRAALESVDKTRQRIAAEILSKCWDSASYVFIGIREVDFQTLLDPKELNALLSKEFGRRFGYFAGEIETVKPSLSLGLKSADREVQKLAIEAVGNIAQVIALGVLPPDVSGQRTLAEEKTRVILIQPANEQLAPLVDLTVEALNSPHPEIKAAAAQTLSKVARGFGQADKPRRELANRIKPDPLLKPLSNSVPVLTELLKSEDLNTRLAIAEVFENIADSVPLGSSLSQASADASPFVRWTTARALHKNFAALDSKGKGTVIKTIAKLLGDPDIDVRNAAVRASVVYAGDGGEVLFPKLLKLLQSGDRETKAVTLESISLLKESANAVVPIAIENLEGNDIELRRAAAKALANYGPAAAAARSALRKTLADPDQELRKAVREALFAIDPPAKPKL